MQPVSGAGNNIGVLDSGSYVAHWWAHVNHGVSVAAAAALWRQGHGDSEHASSARRIPSMQRDCMHMQLSSRCQWHAHSLPLELQLRATVALSRMLLASPFDIQLLLLERRVPVEPLRLEITNTGH